MKDVMVTIYCITYNHIGLIEKALKGFLMQKTDFRFEVWIHDDLSTDGTTEVLKQYENDYPEMINVVYEEENIYSKGESIYERMSPYIRGKYIAICEGDDYWTDEYKLQKQFDFMERHPEVILTTHKALEHNLKTDKKYMIPIDINKDYYPSIEEIIFYGGAKFPTCSFFMRTDCEVKYDRWGNGICGDFNRILHAALKGKVYYSNECMAVHTYLYQGSWSDRYGKNIDKMKEFRLAELDSLDRFNKDTNYIYSRTVEKRRLLIRYQMEYEINKNFKILLTDEYKSIWKGLPIKKRIIICVRAYMPFIYEILNRCRKCCSKNR